MTDLPTCHEGGREPTGGEFSGDLESCVDDDKRTGNPETMVISGKHYGFRTDS